MRWQFLDTGFRTALFNMKFDEILAARLRENAISPTLRVYGWQPHAVSIGRHQPMNSFNVAALGAAEIDIVRRPTGGRAILHANELTYSVVVPCTDRSLRDIYRSVNEGLLRGMRLLGIDAELADAGGDFRKLYSDPLSVACFSNSAKSEIHVNGKKLVGSAQRRYGTVVLQHGSFLLDHQHCKLADFLPEKLAVEGDRLKLLLEESTINAASLLGRSVSFAEAADAIRTGCGEAWNADFYGEEVFSLPEHDCLLN